MQIVLAGKEEVVRAKRGRGGSHEGREPSIRVRVLPLRCVDENTQGYVMLDLTRGSQSTSFHDGKPPTIVSFPVGYAFDPVHVLASF